jgi:hypothetical protein
MEGNVGFFSNLRATGTISVAASFIDKHLSLQADIGRFGVDSRKFAERLVMALWASIPVLANQSANPKAVLVAAAAMAKGIRDADKSGNKQMGDMLHSALQMLILHDVRRLVPIGRAVGIDSDLYDLACAIFEEDKPGDANLLICPSGGSEVSMKSDVPTSVPLAQEAGGSTQTIEIYRCRILPEELEDTERDDVKHCKHCNRNVYRVRGAMGEAELLTDRCLWIESSSSTELGDTIGEYEVDSHQVDGIHLRSLDEFELERNLVNSLKARGICYIGDLIQLTEGELLKGFSIDHMALEEVKTYLSSFGLFLGAKLENWLELRPKI